MQLPTRAYAPGRAGYRRLTPAQARVLVTFEEHGAMDDFTLGYAYRLTHGKMDQAWSGLRTRRAELTAMGVLEVVRVFRNERNRDVGVYGVRVGAFGLAHRA